MYLGIEPHIRRHWPDSLISWSRLQSGRLKDPLVASHILAGIAAVLAYEVAETYSSFVFSQYYRQVAPFPLVGLNGVPAFLAMLFSSLGTPVYLVMLFAPVLRLLARKRLWLADAAAAVLAAAFAFTS